LLANLARLEWWLRHRSYYAEPRPTSAGLWGEIIAQIVRLHRRKRFHKNSASCSSCASLQRSTAALPNGVVILNAQREIVWFNRMAARLLSLRRTADLGMRIENLLREPEFVRLTWARQDFTNPVVIRPMTGEDCYPVAAGRPLWGRAAAAAGERRVAARMRLEAVRRDFVANASHEFALPPPSP